MRDLSVIIPFVLEGPAVLFTVASIYNDLKDSGLDFEVICVDNFCDEVAHQRDGHVNDGAAAELEAASKLHPWLKVLRYTDKLSHWQAKNLAVRESSGRLLWFCDAHCAIPSGTIRGLVTCYDFNHLEDKASLHPTLTYKLLESRQLIYKLHLEAGHLHYKFTSYRNADPNYIMEVPCMSTCGMMLSRQIYDAIGGWPTELGIYGGGENFMNFTLAVCGYKKYILPVKLHHHGASREYHWNDADWCRNNIIAAFVYGGPSWARQFVDGRIQAKNLTGRAADSLIQIYDDVVVKCLDHARLIAKQRVIRIEDWIKQWEGEKDNG